jgi:hypothetical protein
MTISRQKALDIVNAYTERQILDYVVDFIENVPKAMAYVTQDEISDNPVFLKLHAFGLIKNDDSFLRPLFESYRVKVESKGSGITDDFNETLPEYES